MNFVPFWNIWLTVLLSKNIFSFLYSNNIMICAQWLMKIYPISCPVLSVQICVCIPYVYVWLRVERCVLICAWWILAGIRSKRRWRDRIGPVSDRAPRLLSWSAECLREDRRPLGKYWHHQLGLVYSGKTTSCKYYIHTHTRTHSHTVTLSIAFNGCDVVADWIIAFSYSLLQAIVTS